MDPEDKPTGETADEDGSPVYILKDDEGLGAECVVADLRWQKVFDDAFHGRAAAAIRSCLATAGRGPAELTLLLTDDDGMARLNGAHRGRPEPTNVLSFPADRPGGSGSEEAYLGDVALAWGVVDREAGGAGLDVRDHALHLIVHGVLHLLGHDHATEEEAASMESAEAAILAAFGVADPYAAGEEASR